MWEWGFKNISCLIRLLLLLSCPSDVHCDDVKIGRDVRRRHSHPRQRHLRRSTWNVQWPVANVLSVLLYIWIYCRTYHGNVLVSTTLCVASEKTWSLRVYMIVPGVQKCKTNLMQISEHLIVAYNCFFFVFFCPCVYPLMIQLVFLNVPFLDPYFFIFVFIFNTFLIQLIVNEICWMTGFKQRISGVGRERSTNWAKNHYPKAYSCCKRLKPFWSRWSQSFPLSMNRHWHLGKGLSMWTDLAIFKSLLQYLGLILVFWMVIYSDKCFRPLNKFVNDEILKKI